MAITALQAAQERAKQHGIRIAMQDDYLRDAVIVRGVAGDIEYRHEISRRFIQQHRIEALDGIYADAHNLVINKLLGAAPEGRDMGRIQELERELDKYKAAVKQLAFQLEMAERGGNGALLKESEVRRLALEQASEHLMDHGIITTGGELVEVCEQIKKLQSWDIRGVVEVKTKPSPAKEWEVPF